jgi:hypothetical protein
MFYLSSENEHSCATVVGVCAHERDPVVVHVALTHRLVLRENKILI